MVDRCHPDVIGVNQGMADETGNWFQSKTDDIAGISPDASTSARKHFLVPACGCEIVHSPRERRCSRSANRWPGERDGYSVEVLHQHDLVILKLVSAVQKGSPVRRQSQTQCRLIHITDQSSLVCREVEEFDSPVFVLPGIKKIDASA